MTTRHWNAERSNDMTLDMWLATSRRRRLLARRPNASGWWWPYPQGKKKTPSHRRVRTMTSSRTSGNCIHPSPCTTYLRRCCIGRRHIHRRHFSEHLHRRADVSLSPCPTNPKPKVVSILKLVGNFAWPRSQSSDVLHLFCHEVLVSQISST